MRLFYNVLGTVGLLSMVAYTFLWFCHRFGRIKISKGQFTQLATTYPCKNKQVCLLRRKPKLWQRTGTMSSDPQDLMVSKYIY